jgi:starch synthase
LNILFVSAEADPFAKVGGLADVIGSLPAALRREGLDARVLMPFYATINGDRWGLQYVRSFTVSRPSGTTETHLFMTHHDGVPVYFLRGWPYFGQESSVYNGPAYDPARFVYFSQAVLDAIDALSDDGRGWRPLVVHANDWHTGIVPFLISQRRQHDWRWETTAAVLGIHNMAYQGNGLSDVFYQHGVPARDNWQLHMRGLTDNALAMAIAYSDIITTVSPRYATEIQYPYQGYGLDGLIRERAADLRGILNGIDVDMWNPATDPHLPVRYSADDFHVQRIGNKRQLQAESGLPVRDDVPVIGFVSRLVWQKGIDLALPALREQLWTEDVQVVALGSGEPEYNEQLWRLGAEFPGRVHTYIGYNAAVAQHIYAGCDIFLMPSHYEPCGVGQMLAMRYGALPLVRETGGLADTVENYDDGPADRGTGFVFNWETADALLGTLRWATRTFRERPGAWRRMQERAMRTDFSWKKSAHAYIEAYTSAAARYTR